MYRLLPTRALVLLLLMPVLPAILHAQSTAVQYAGTWEGTYTARQGTTRVVLVIEALDSVRIKGHYIFFADNANPEVPTGHYTIKGSVDLSTGFLTLSGKEWIIKPKNYVFAGFSGAMSTDGRFYTGEVSVETEGVIGTFTIQRLTSVPALPDKDGATTGEQ